MSEAGRTRRLRKYEAAPVVIRRDPGPPPLDLVQPFGPILGRSVAPPALVARLNAYAAPRVRPDRSHEFLLEPDFVGADSEAVGPFLETLIARWVAAIDGAPPKRVTLEAVWIVSQYANSASPLHFHSGDVSGVLYLCVPQVAGERQEEEKTYISGRRAGHLNFMTGGKQRFAKTLLSVKPRVGDVLVFPGWLLHGVEPFDGAGERRSLAFNAYVED